MSRSGYSDDNENFAVWRGVIASATRGKRGQRFFRDLVAALDAMPVKLLIAGAIESAGEVCALGCLARRRGVPTEHIQPYDHDALGEVFDIASQLAQETMWINDEAGPRTQTPEQRWERVRLWAARQIRVSEDELLPLPAPPPGEGQTT